MPNDTFSRNPYPDIHVSEKQRQQLIEVVDGCMQTNFQKYEDFVLTDKHQVDERRWERVKSRENLHVYTVRSQKDQTRRGIVPTKVIRQSDVEKDMLVMMSAGTLVGELKDLMFGILNTTRDAMRIKAAYVGDVNGGAILSSVVEPSEKEPFRSLVVKWMEISMKAGKSRDFVCIEATDVLHLENGATIGYHVLHSIEFPQTSPLPNTVRGNVSSVSFFRHVRSTIIDSFGIYIVDPGVNSSHRSFIPSAAKTILTATNYVRCGQIKKLAWLMQRQHAGYKVREEIHHSKECVMCGKSKNLPGISRSTCKLCYGHVCYSCKVRVRMNFIGGGSQLIERRIAICSQCMSKAINCSAQEAAQDQAVGYYHDSYDSASTLSDSAVY